MQSSILIVAILLVLVIMTFVSSTNAQWTTSEIMSWDHNDANINTSNMVMVIGAIMTVLALVF